MNVLETRHQRCNLQDKTYGVVNLHYENNAEPPNV
jgi:hypothetical protein